VVDPWVKKHKQIIKKKYDDRGQHRSDDQILIEHNIHFATWFKQQIKERPLSAKHKNAKLIYALSTGPACNLATYQTYDINGYTFYMEAKDKNSEYQNSRVTMEAWNANGDEKRDTTAELKIYGNLNTLDNIR
jgi:hypothetical protein